MKVIVGLETHIMVDSKKKLFCSCTPDFDQCSICRGVPGSLPTIPSTQILNKIVALAKVLNCKLNPKINFYRKHYYYVDLPNGYQRTQLPSQSIAQTGGIKLVSNSFIVPIRDLYLEQDPAAIEKYSINYKRSGNPLIEVVTSPCFVGTSKKVCTLITEYLRTLTKLAIDLEICNRSKSIKTDVNVSLPGGKYRYEIKNITSIADIRKCIPLAIPLLEREDESNKTFHFKNKLIFSRLKTNYLYTKEYNLPAIELTNKSSTQMPITLYDIYTKIYQKYPNPSAYAYAKLITPIIKTDPTQLEYYLSFTPVKGINQFKLKKDTKLQNIIKEYLITQPLTKTDYDQKNQLFRSFVKGLKKELLDSNVSFNSLSINTELSKIFY